MLASTFFRDKYAAGLEYPAYVATGSPEQQRRWNNLLTAATLSQAQTSLLASFTRPVRLLAISGVWCGDCIEQLPFLHRFAQANPSRIGLRLLDRDQHKDLASQLRICNGDRIPVVLFLSEDFDFLSILGDRSLARYRAKARRDLGECCSTGLVVPPAEELSSTLADWLNELERVQLMLRLSTRYRQKYGD